MSINSIGGNTSKICNTCDDQPRINNQKNVACKAKTPSPFRPQEITPPQISINQNTDTSSMLDRLLLMLIALLEKLAQLLGGQKPKPEPEPEPLPKPIPIPPHPAGIVAAPIETLPKPVAVPPMINGDFVSVEPKPDSGNQSPDADITAENKQEPVLVNPFEIMK